MTQRFERLMEPGMIGCCPVSVDCFRLDRDSLDAILLQHLLVFDRGKVAEG